MTLTSFLNGDWQRYRILNLIRGITMIMGWAINLMLTVFFEGVNLWSLKSGQLQIPVRMSHFRGANTIRGTNTYM